MGTCTCDGSYDSYCPRCGWRGPAHAVSIQEAIGDEVDARALAMEEVASRRGSLPLNHNPLLRARRADPVDLGPLLD